MVYTNKQKEYQKRPEVISRRKEYDKSPERKSYKKRYNHLYRQRYGNAYNQLYRSKCRDFILSFKENKCCSICGWKEHPSILQFHHTLDKISNVSRLSNIKKIKEEMAKCILLCPNCHTWVHYDNK
jgi:hypothetical protein